MEDPLARVTRRMFEFQRLLSQAAVRDVLGWLRGYNQTSSTAHYYLEAERSYRDES